MKMDLAQMKLLWFKEIDHLKANLLITLYFLIFPLTLYFEAYMLNKLVWKHCYNKKTK